MLDRASGPEPQKLGRDQEKLSSFPSSLFHFLPVDDRAGLRLHNAIASGKQSAPGCASFTISLAFAKLQFSPKRCRTGPEPTRGKPACSSFRPSTCEVANVSGSSKAITHR